MTTIVPPVPAVPETYLRRVRDRLATGERLMIGVTGCPGAGKSTVAEALRAAFAEVAQVVPMDGYHLANVELSRLGFSQRKGAPYTFDAVGYVSLLRRLRRQRPDEVIYAPEFRREIEEPIAGAIPVFPETRLIITEGIYLLLEDGHWAEVRPLLDEVWYIDIDDAVRVGRLVRRHERFGRSHAEAQAWVENNDELNARLIEVGKPRADLLFRWDAD